MRHIAMLLTGAAITAAVGCGEVTEPLPRNYAQTLNEEQSDELTPVSAFAIEIAVTSSDQGDVRIVGLVTARLNAEGTHLAIAAPEIEVLRSAGGRVSDFRVPANRPIPRLADDYVDMKQGGRRTITANVHAAVPGYYRVVVSAVVDSPEVSLGQYQQYTVHKEVWLLVDSTGITVHDRFSPEKISPQYVVQAGPFRKRNTAQAESGRLDGPNASALSLGDGYDYVKIMYYNDDTDSYGALAGAYVDYTIYEEINGTDTEVGSGGTGTGEDGVYYFYCSDVPTEHHYYSSIVRLNDGNVSVMAGPYYGGGGPGGDQCGTIHTADNPYTVYLGESNAPHAYTNLRNSIAASRAFFQRSRSLVITRIASSGGSKYSRSSDEITIATSNIWGPFGRFTAAHEYGHALHPRALGGIPSYSCTDHHIDQQVDITCAYGEGFADYHAEATGAVYFNVESADYTRGCTSYAADGTCLARVATPNGKLVEGAVAGFLYDLTDPANEPADQVIYPGSYVADIVATCSVQRSVFWYRINGIDEAIYCFEQQVDHSLSSTYAFRDAAYYREYASEPGTWNRSQIRSAWLWSLYRQ